MKKTLLAGLAIALLALPAFADNTITAGSDVFQTAGDGNTYTDVNLPAGFFCPTSSPVSAHIVFVGVPFTTSPADAFGATDTLIERLTDTTFNSSNVATVNAVVRAVSFKGSAPVTVTGCSGSSLWDVKVSAAPGQTPFLMTIQRPSATATGGTFSAAVSITPRLNFKQQGSSATVSVDEAPINFSTSAAEWTHQPGAGGVTHTAAVQIDTDGNGVTDVSVPGTSNFAAGYSPFPRTGCGTPPCPSPISHADIIARHLTQPSPVYCSGTRTGGLSQTSGLAMQQDQLSRCIFHEQPANPIPDQPIDQPIGPSQPIDQPAQPAQPVSGGTSTTLNGTNGTLNGHN